MEDLQACRGQFGGQQSVTLNRLLAASAVGQGRAGLGKAVQGGPGGCVARAASHFGPKIFLYIYIALMLRPHAHPIYHRLYRHRHTPVSRGTCSPQADIYLSFHTTLCLGLLPPPSFLWQEYLVLATDPVPTR